MKRSSKWKQNTFQKKTAQKAHKSVLFVEQLSYQNYNL